MKAALLLPLRLPLLLRPLLPLLLLPALTRTLSQLRLLASWPKKTASTWLPSKAPAKMVV
ncbi:hypothetical protein D3C87_1823920 [compost metagenome]